MGRVGKIVRRTFLVGSAAIVSGVAFGVYSYRKPVFSILENRSIFRHFRLAKVVPAKVRLMPQVVNL